MSDCIYRSWWRAAEIARAKKVREIVLATLYVGRPEGLTGEALRAVVCLTYGDASVKEIDREADYLAMKGLITVEQSHWRSHCKLTVQGIDHFEAGEVRP